MDGFGGLSNWRWIFIIEGLLTLVVGVATFFFISDFPLEATWLNTKGKNSVLFNKSAHEKQSEIAAFEDVLEFFKDPKNYLAAIMYFCKPLMIREPFMSDSVQVLLLRSTLSPTFCRQ
jgi:MFS family permease